MRALRGAPLALMGTALALVFGEAVVNGLCREVPKLGLLLAVPLGLLVVALKAKLLPRYYARQIATTAKAGSFGGRYRAILYAAIAPWAGGIAGGLPGLGFALLVGRSVPEEITRAIVLVGFVAGFVYVRLGAFFVEQAACIEGIGGRAALARSFELARGRRLRLAALALLLFFVQIAGVVGLALVIVGGLVTIPAARVLRDATTTEMHAAIVRGEIALDAVFLGRVRDGIRAFLVPAREAAGPADAQPTRLA